jgi:hypothetical protein
LPLDVDRTGARPSAKNRAYSCALSAAGNRPDYRADSSADRRALFGPGCLASIANRAFSIDPHSFAICG